MKILLISAYYPPYHKGGYEIRIKNIVDNLIARNHLFYILSTKIDHKNREIINDHKISIIRKLNIRNKNQPFIKEFVNDFFDLILIRKNIIEFTPDLIYLGHINPLSKAIFPFLAGIRLPILIDEGGIGIIHAWTKHGRLYYFIDEYRRKSTLIRFFKKLIIYILGLFSRNTIKNRWLWPNQISVIFNSELNKENALKNEVRIKDYNVIRSGIDLKVFSFKYREELSTMITILHPGRIERQKGNLDSVRLVRYLLQNGISSKLILSGTINDNDYLEEIKIFINKYKLNDSIFFQEQVSQIDLSINYQKADICFFPSYAQTGFSRVPLEAMATGCLIFSYGNEGSQEIINHNKNGFLISENDFHFIFQKIRDFQQNKIDYQKVIKQARLYIEKNHDLDDYIEKIDTYIQNLTNCKNYE